MAATGATVKVGKQGTTLATVTSGSASAAIPLSVGSNAITARGHRRGQHHDEDLHRDGDAGLRLRLVGDAHAGGNNGGLVRWGDWLRKLN